MTFRVPRIPGSSLGRGWAAAFALSFILATPSFAGPISLDVFYEFSFTDAGVTAAGCSPDDPLGDFCIPSSGTPTSFLDAPPWTFASSVASVLTVTDAFQSGDQFEVFDFGTSLGLTSVPVAGIDCGDDPVPCLATPGISSRAFLLSSGAHSLTIVATLSEGGGAGYLKASEVPEPLTCSLLAMGVMALGIHRRSLRGAA